jgi:energy-converting hydrogenase Eha subunit F
MIAGSFGRIGATTARDHEMTREARRGLGHIAGAFGIPAHSRDQWYPSPAPLAPDEADTPIAVHDHGQFASNSTGFWPRS